ncbi:hypothetical protein INT48_009143, partial [Thamnidium elegans]
CPSCIDLDGTKSALKAHLEEHFVSFSQLINNPEDTWIVEDNNLLEIFDEYKAHCLSEKIKYKSLDSHFKELLAMSSILVLQRRNDYAEALNEFIGAPILDKAYM